MIKEILLKTGEWFERIDPNPSATVLWRRRGMDCA